MWFHVWMWMCVWMWFHVITCVCQISDEDFLDSILSLDLGEEVAHILLKVSSVMRNERSRWPWDCVSFVCSCTRNTKGRSVAPSTGCPTSFQPTTTWNGGWMCRFVTSELSGSIQGWLLILDSHMKISSFRNLFCYILEQTETRWLIVESILDEIKDNVSFTSRVISQSHQLFVFMVQFSTSLFFSLMLCFWTQTSLLLTGFLPSLAVGQSLCSPAAGSHGNTECVSNEWQWQREQQGAADGARHSPPHHLHSGGCSGNQQN